MALALAPQEQQKQPAKKWQGILNLIGDIVEGVGEKAGLITNAVLDGAASIHDSVTAGIGYAITGGLPSLPNTQEIGAKVQTQEMAYTPVAAAIDPHHVDMETYGRMAPPPLPVNISRGGKGMDMA